MGKGKTARRRAKGKVAAPRHKPGFEGRRELVEVSLVNPYAVRETPLALGEEPQPTLERVTVNARHDAIEHMFSKGVIDWPEREAARHIRSLVETMGLAAMRTMMADMDRVDGGGARQSITDAQLQAGRELARLARALGEVWFGIVVRVAGYGETVTMVAIDHERDEAGRANGACSRATRDHVGWSVREGLSLAAARLGYRGAPIRGGAVRVWADGDAEAARAGAVEKAASPAAQAERIRAGEARKARLAARSGEGAG